MLRALRERFRRRVASRGDSPVREIPPGVALTTAFLLGLWTFLVVTNVPVRVAVDGSPVAVAASVTDWGGASALLLSIVGLAATVGLLLRRLWGYVGTLVASSLGAILAFRATTTPGDPHEPFWTVVLVALVVVVAYLMFGHEQILSAWIADRDSR